MIAVLVIVFLLGCASFACLFCRVGSEEGRREDDILGGQNDIEMIGLEERP